MGTALVVYEDQKAWEAAHDLQREKAKIVRQTPARWLAVFVIFFVLWIYVTPIQRELFSDDYVWPLFFLNMALIFSPLWVFVPYIVKGKFLEINDLPMSCPTCHKEFNLNQKWTCGYCKERHNPVFPFNNSLFLGCDNKGCSTPRGVPKHRAQTAIQCPHCKDHTVINPLLYKQIGSANAENKYPGVARFLDDTSPPVLGGRSDLLEVGDLGSVLKSALDKSVG